MAVSPVLHSVKCGDAAVKATLKLGRFNFMVLSRPQTSKTKGHFILKRFEGVNKDLLNELATGAEN